MEWTNYNPEWRYDDPRIALGPGQLPKGSRIKWPDGETALVVQCLDNLGNTRHLVRRSAVGGGEQEETLYLKKIDGLMTTATPIKPRGREGGRNPINPDEPMQRHQIRINDSLWDKAVEIGDGNASNGIRQALEQWDASA